MPTPSIYSPAVARQVCDALSAGRRATSVASILGVDRTTLYNWRREHDGFAAAWDQAVQLAGDRLEELIYDRAMGGDIDAARYWLKSFRPAIHDRAALVKLAMLQVSLAALTKKGGSGEPPILDLDENGLPVVVATRGDGLTDGKAMKPIMTMVLPYNGRHGPQPALEDDSSGRTLPLPSRVMVEVDENGEAMTLAADGKPVAPGAVRTLWRRIKAYNALAVDSGPARQDRPYYGNSAAPPESTAAEPVAPVDELTESAAAQEAGTSVYEHHGPTLDGTAEPPQEPQEPRRVPL
jgi:hypothetical protein